MSRVTSWSAVVVVVLGLGIGSTLCEVPVRRTSGVDSLDVAAEAVTGGG